MIRIAFTQEAILPDEKRWICRILDHGWTAVHLRHPLASYEEMDRLINSIPAEYHSRLRLHSHFQLAMQYGLGGIHLNHRNPTPPEGYSGSISRSCHSVDEVYECSECDYVTLSPIFDSVSKPSYRGNFSSKELHRLDKIDSPLVIALGGITSSNVHLLKDYSFAGYAVLGALMQARSIAELDRTLATFSS